MKRNKKLFSLVLSVILVISLVPAAVFAATITETDHLTPGTGISTLALTGVSTYSSTRTDENYTAFGYAAKYKSSEDMNTAIGALSFQINALDATEPPTDSSGIYQIQTASELLWFQNAVSNGNSNIKAELIADIDLSTVCSSSIGNWVSIPAFSGVFDGQGHTISNLYISGAAVAKQGLFAEVSESGIVKNVGITYATVEMTTSKKVNNANAGALVGLNNGTITNCFVKGCSITTNGTASGKGGAVCGNNAGVIENTYAINCAVTEANNKQHIGGIAGYSNGTIKSCYAVNITLTTTHNNAYPISGSSTTGTYNNCYTLTTDKADPNAQSKDDTWFKSPDAITALGGAYNQDTNNINDGFPVLVFTDATIDKSALGAALSAVPTSGYYTTDDRYNGFITSNNGFWSEMQDIISVARETYDNNDATQIMVDYAFELLDQTNPESALSKSIANLIPVTQLNATKLYECIAQYGNYSDSVLADRTEYTANAYRTAVQNANNYLGLLFDNGVATDTNVAANQGVADGYADALENAVKDFVVQTEADRYSEYKQIVAALDSSYSMADGNGYTSDSWTRFQTAKEYVHSKQNALPSASQLTGRAYSEYTAAVKEYWLACYNLVSADGATVHVRIADNLGAVDDSNALASEHALYSEDVALTDSTGYTLYDLAQQTGVLTDTNIRFWAVYINGMFVRCLDSEDNAFWFNPDEGTKTDWHDITVKDGDEVVFANVKAPTKSVYQQTGIMVDFEHYRSCINMLRFTDAQDLTVKAGNSVSLSVEYTSAYLPDYTGRWRPKANAELIVYGPKQSDGSYPMSLSGVKTGSSGVAELTLTEGGEYYITAVDTRTMDPNSDFFPNLYIAPEAVKLTVTELPADELADKIEELLAEFDAYWAAVDQEMFTEEELSGPTGILAWVDTYRKGIEEAETLSYASGSLASGKAYIDGIVAEVEAANAKVAEDLEKVLNLLPDEAEDFTKDFQVRFGELKSLVDGMTEYQRKQMTGAQEAKYEMLLQLYGEDGSTLPDRRTFKLSFVVTGSGVSHDALIDQSYRYVLQSGFVEEEIYSKTVTAPQMAFGEGFDFSPGASVQIYGFPIEWGQEIKISSARVSGADAVVDLIDEGTYQATTYPDQGTRRYELYINMYNMPSHDVTIYITIKDPNVDPTLDEKKEAALAELEEAYKAYSKSDYTSENWSALVDAYDQGKSAINAAADAAAVDAAKAAAIEAMAAVEKRDPGSLGTVHVTVSNNTYSNGAFYDASEPFVDTEIALQPDMTMMEAILTGLEQEGYRWNGAPGKTISYLSCIYVDENGNGVQDADEPSLAEFDGGPEAGWMGTLNDWFTNEGFASFTASSSDRDHRIVDGDELSVKYTCSGLGADIGGLWGSSDTTLASLTVTGGTLSPTFSGDANEYVLRMNGENISVIPTATNKNYQVKTFLNEKLTTRNVDYYRSGEVIPAKAGDVIYVGCGERAWLSMNNQGVDAINYNGTWYTITLVDENSVDVVEDLIDEIGTVTYSNYTEKAAAVEAARSAYDALSDAAKAEVDNYDVLATDEEAIAGFEKADELKAAIAELPGDMSTAQKEELQAVKALYEELTDAQKKLLTVAEKAKLDSALAALDSIINAELAADKAAIEALDWTVPQETANDAESLKAFIEGKLAGLSLNGTAVVTVGSVTPAVEGTAANEAGTNGSYSFTVALTKDGASDTASVEDAQITATAYAAPYVTLKSANLTLEGKISINYKLIPSAPGMVAKLYYEKYNSDTGNFDFNLVKTVDIDSAPMDGDRYVISYDQIPAKEMTMALRIMVEDASGNSAVVKTSKTEGDHYDYSVATWANNKINNPESTASDVLLGKALLVYGQAAQKALKYCDGVDGRPDRLANPNGYLSATVNSLKSTYAQKAPVDEYSRIVPPEVKAAGAKSVYLTLESDTTVNVKFTDPSAEVRANDPSSEPIALEPIAENGTTLYKASISGIAAKNMHKLQKFYVNDISDPLQYGVLSWANSKWTAGGADGDLAVGLYIYNAAARMALPNSDAVTWTDPYSWAD